MDHIFGVGDDVASPPWVHHPVDDVEVGRPPEGHRGGHQQVGEGGGREVGGVGQAAGKRKHSGIQVIKKTREILHTGDKASLDRCR